MALFVRALVVCAAGVAIGLLASAYALSRLSLFDDVRLGPWGLEAHAGSTEADPYTLARLERTGEIPLAAGEGLQLIAGVDDEGRTLDARCLYRVGPSVPTARYWTLSLIDPQGWPVDNPAGRYGFRSSEILRASDGTFTITIAADVQPGNWLPIGRPGPFALALRLYDSPLGATAGAIDQSTAPHVTRVRLPMMERLRRDEAVVLVAATVILATLVHFIVVLLAPHVATRDAFARLAPLGALNETVLLPRASPSDKTLSFADPSVATAFCRYDLASGPIRIRAPAGRSMSTISFHTRLGLVYYALTDRAAVNGVVGAVLGTPASLRALAVRDDEESPTHDLRVAAPAREGYVTIRVFSEFPSLYRLAEAEAMRLTCNPEPAPQ